MRTSAKQPENHPNSQETKKTARKQKVNCDFFFEVQNQPASSVLQKLPSRDRARARNRARARAGLWVGTGLESTPVWLISALDSRSATTLGTWPPEAAAVRQLRPSYGLEEW